MSNIFPTTRVCRCFCKLTEYSADSGKGLRTRGPVLLFIATLTLYFSTTLFCVAGYVAAFAVQKEEVASANAAFARNAQALFNPLWTAKFVSRMSCIQTSALTINVRLPRYCIFTYLGLRTPDLRHRCSLGMRSYGGERL